MRIIQACALAHPLLIAIDGLRSYVQAIQEVFRSPLPSGKRGRPRLVPWPDIHIGQVIKGYQGRHLVDITRRMAQGGLQAARTLLNQSRGGLQLNTAFIERLNATFRSRLAVLVRRTHALLRCPQTLEPLMYLIGCVYNFCTAHQSLPRLDRGQASSAVQVDPTHPSPRPVPVDTGRGPALAAGLSDHIWSVKELLSYRVSPPAWVPPRHRGRRSQAEKALIAKWCS